MVALLYRMNSGIPGAMNRLEQCTVETVMVTPVGTAGAPGAYGLAGVVDATSGQFRIPNATDTAIYGLLVRAYPTTASQDGLGVSTPPASGPVDIEVRGYMTVLLGGATASKKGGTVYVRKANAAGGKPIGGVEAAPDLGVPVVAAKAGGNTGTGTFVIDGAAPVSSTGIEGIYTLRCITAVANGGVFRLTNPNGVVLGDFTIAAGAGGIILVNDQIKGVLTDGGVDFIVGDGFDVTVTFNTIQLSTKSYFMGGADASGNVEIAFNI